MKRLLLATAALVAAVAALCGPRAAGITRPASPPTRRRHGRGRHSHPHKPIRWTEWSGRDRGRRRPCRTRLHRLHRSRRRDPASRSAGLPPGRAVHRRRRNQHRGRPLRRARSPGRALSAGGEPRDVVEDVKRLGGFGYAAHPDSPKTELPVERLVAADGRHGDRQPRHQLACPRPRTRAYGRSSG